MEEAASSANLVGELFGDRYRLTAVLGAGGMGSAYLADDEHMSGRQVAIKVPHDEFLLVPGFRKRFGLEIRQLINLEHPHIVTILDSGEFEDRPYAVLQYLGGGSLSDRLEELGRHMTEAEVRRWLPTVAGALDFIHRKGFLHRDVKPGNILFDTEGHPFIADFGTSTALGGEGFTRVTQAGTILGSPAFMAPEYGTGDAGPPYDQYALGVVVYRCLCGKLPHDPQPTPIAYLAKKMTEPPAPLGPRAPGASAGLVTAVMRALSAKPDDRFASCAEFAAAVAEGEATSTSTGAFGVLPAPSSSAPDLNHELAPEFDPLAETVRFDEAAAPAISTSVAEQYERRLARRRALRRQQDALQTLPPFNRGSAEASAAADDDDDELFAVAEPGTPVMIWNALIAVFAFVIGVVVLSEGSNLVFDLANPLASADAARLAAWESQVALLVVIAAGANLLLSLVAGYVVAVFAEIHWQKSCAALAVVAVALTGWETGFLVPLVNSRAIALLSATGMWLSLVTVPVGILAGGAARDQQDSARPLGAALAAAAVVVIVVARVLLTAVS